MSTLVLAGLAVLVAVVVGLALVGRARRGPAEPEGPRTVAELVALRAEQAAAAAEPGTKPAVERARAPGGDRPAAATELAVGPTSADADEPAPDAGPGQRWPAARVRRAAEPDPGPRQSEPDAAPRRPEPAERPPAPAPAAAADAEIDLNGDDTPWRRAALMSAGAGTGAPIAYVPKLVSPPSRDGQRIEETPVWNEPGDDPQDDEWTGWADWDAVDAEVEAETRASTRADGRPPRVPGQGGGPDRVRLVAVDQHAATPDDHPPGTRPTALTVVGDPPRPQVEAAAPAPVDPAIAAAPVADTSTAAPAPVVPPPFKYASPPVVAAAPAAHPVPGSPPDDDPVLVDPDPPGPASQVPARSPRRPLRTPAEQAAEQAAADLALLRTLGYADPSLLPQSAPVVSLVSRTRTDEPAAPAMSGVPQPLGFRAADHHGKPVPLAAVTLLDDRGQQVAATTADAVGAGELQVPNPGAYMLVARAPGHQAGAVAVTVADAPAFAEVVLTRSASVHGVVFGEDGPIAGARVTLVQDGEIVEAVDSGPDGSYRLDDVIAGEYGLSVAAAGCEPFAAMAVVPDETDLCQDVELEPALPQADQDETGQDAAGFQDVAEMLLGGQGRTSGGSR
jgi:hypothetical protein